MDENLDSLQKSTGLISRADTAGVIARYPLNDLNYSRVSGQPKLGAERVRRLPILIKYSDDREMHYMD